MDTPTTLATFDTKSLLTTWFDLDWNYENRLDSIQKLANIIIKDTLELAKKHENASPTTELEIQNSSYFYYEWTPQIKALLVLIRDILFEQQKGVIQGLDAIQNKQTLEDTWAKSVEILLGAQQELLKFSTPSQIKKTALKEKKNWHHQNNPWELYQDQITVLEKQINDLIASHNKLVDLFQIFDAVSTLTHDNLKDCDDQFNTIIDKLDKLIQHETNNVDSNDFIATLLEYIDNIPPNFYHQEYNLLLKNNLTKTLKPHNENLNLLINTQGGLLEQRNFHPQKEIERWLDSEIFPLFYEIWEIGETISTGLKMIVLNLKNRIQILKQDKAEIGTKEMSNLLSPLLLFKKDITTASQHRGDLYVLIEKRLEEAFKISYFFDTSRYFLPISLQSTINQKFWEHQSDYILKIKNGVIYVLKKVKGLQRKIATEQNLSLSEKIALCLHSRKLDESNVHYTSIFQTKGYVGDSFFIGRTREMTRIEEMINHWKKGLRGAVLVTGQRFAGKTIFSEAVAHHFFVQKTIRLIPNTILEVAGHKTRLSCDLAYALEHVTKYDSQQKKLVIIDDLEQWWDKDIPFYKNINALTEYIDKYSNKFFFMVMVNSKSKQQLFRFSHIERIFQAEVNLNKISKTALSQAIAIRHGATHKKLVDKKGNPYSPKAFSKLVSKIHSIANANIGNALNIWANTTYYSNENNVISKLDEYRHLPNFLKEDSILILETILMHKKTNEYKLNQLFGPAFKSRYATIVRRLVSTGILTRDLDGSIQITPSIVNDLATLLD